MAHHCAGEAQLHTTVSMTHLSEEQTRAVEHTSGPVVIAAGAGSGKTTVVTDRIGRLVRSGVDPERILATTFSVRAAREMSKRLSVLGCIGARIQTFHSLAYMILRNEDPRYESWNIDDSDRYRIVVKDTVGYRGMNWQGADVTYLLSFVGRCKAAGALAEPDNVEALLLAKRLYARKPTLQRNPQLCTTAYVMAEELRRERQILTFDDMLLEVWQLFARDEHARMRWASQFDYVIQDECLAGDTPVLLGDGTARTIRELVAEKYAGDVITWAPTLGTVRRKVIGWAKKPGLRPMVRVAVRQLGFLENGQRMAETTERVRYNTRYLVCTEEHPVWAPERGWVRAGMLAVGDRVQVETDAPYVPAYANRVKHSDKGRSRLGELMRAKNESGACGQSGMSGRVVKRGGNGTGPSESEAALLDKLGDGWVHNHVVPTGRSSKNGPTHYKLDVAHPERRVAIEVDGNSHKARDRRRADTRKDEFLQGLGWTVIRLTNRESWRVTDDVLRELVPQCPAPAEVVSVEPWEAKEPWVYDIAIDDVHAFYADGVLVHNCQDENPVQHYIAEQLARDHQNYMIVGDTAQSIYGFRGADPASMLNFEREWAASVVRLNGNYRSGKSIIDLANSSLAAMPPDTHLGVELVARRDVDGKVTLTAYQNFDDEGEGIADHIMQAHADGLKWSEIVLLYRTNAQSRGPEESLLTAGIPYRVLGGVNFLDRREVRDLLAYVRVAMGVGKWDDVRRSLNSPFRFIGKSFLDGLEAVLGDEPADMVDEVRDFAKSTAGLQPRQRTAALTWCGIIEQLAAVIGEGERQETPTRGTPAELAARPATLLDGLVTDLKYSQWLTRDEGAESPENNRVSNVRELIRMATRFPTTRAFLDYAADILRRSKEAKITNTDKDVVTLCTIHRSKGLEWKLVFLLGCNEKILPHAACEDVNEERRLFYVAATRARDELSISYVRQAAVSDRLLDLEPSRFLAETKLVAREVV